MTPVCFRLDLDSTPWDATSAYGVEQARLVALFDFARRTGVKFHVFASSRALRASPGLVDAVLGDGHDLDWLFAGDAGDWEGSAALLHGTGHSWWGLGAVVPWVGALSGCRFVSAPSGEGVYSWGETEPVSTLRFALGQQSAKGIEAEIGSHVGEGRRVLTLRDWVSSQG